jgi:phosphoribosylanthranilate isomerase
MFRVKICGLTRPQDVKASFRAGADALGFQMSLGPRKIRPSQARALARLVPANVLKVGVFVGEPLEKVRRISAFCGFDAVQLHGDEDERYCAAVGLPVLKSVGMRNVKTPFCFQAYPIAALLLDRYNQKIRGGTGQSFSWKWALAAEKLHLPILLAGGLHPGNVAEAIRTARPFGVDTSSGVEMSPGIKNAVQINLFVKKARAAFQQIDSQTI